MAFEKGHQLSVVNKGGCPLKFETPEKLQEAIDGYFRSCIRIYPDGTKEYVRPLTLSGLAVDLGCDLDTIRNYEKRDKYFGTIQRAKRIIHNYAEEQLFVGKNTAGVIFNMINNYKGEWSNKQEYEISAKKGSDLSEDQQTQILEQLPE